MVLDKKALNIEMLKIAGFTCTGGIWTYPDGVDVDNGVPFFLESFDECLKWLVPKVYDMELIKRNRFEGEWQVAYGARVRLAQKPWQDCITDKNPAVAFCLAMKELMK